MDQGSATTERSVSFEDVEELDRLDAEIASLAAKAKARFGGGTARERRATLQARQRALLERLGVPDVEAARAMATADVADEVDPVLLDFARRELTAAEEAWEEIQSMEVPDDQPEDEPIELADDEGSEAPAIDLRVNPPTAS